MIEVSDPRFSIAIDPARRRAWIRFFGVADMDTTLYAVRTTFENEVFNRDIATVVSFRDSTRIDMEMSAFKAVSAELSKMEERPVVAALVTGDDLGRYMLGKLYIAISLMIAGRTLQRKTFRSEEEAENWFVSLEKKVDEHVS